MSPRAVRKTEVLAAARRATPGPTSQNVRERTTPTADGPPQAARGNRDRAARARRRADRRSALLPRHGATPLWAVPRDDTPSDLSSADAAALDPGVESPTRPL